MVAGIDRMLLSRDIFLVRGHESELGDKTRFQLETVMKMRTKHFGRIRTALLANLEISSLFLLKHRTTKERKPLDNSIKLGERVGRPRYPPPTRNVCSRPVAIIRPVWGPTFDSRGLINFVDDPKLPCSHFVSSFPPPLVQIYLHFNQVGRSYGPEAMGCDVARFIDLKPFTKSIAFWNLIN